MNKEILKDYGWCRVIKRGPEYYLKLDKCSIAIKMATYEILENQANEAINNETEAENITKSLLLDKSKEEIGSL